MLGGEGAETEILLATGSATNYLAPGAATNSPAWFYRVRLAP